MKLIYLIFLMPLTVMAQSPEMISIKDYNPQKKYDKPICVVDMYGEMECKELPKAPKAEATNQAPAKPLLNAAEDSSWEGQVLATGFGSIRGAGGNVTYHDGQYSFGAALKFNMYNPPINQTVDSKMEAMALGLVSYHVFPRWYSYAKGHKQFDLSISGQFGYNYITQSTLANRKSEPIVGMGLQISYPLTDNIRAVGGVDVYQNFSFKSIGSGGSIGLGFDF